LQRIKAQNSKQAGRKKEKVIALLLSDGNPSSLGEGPGERAKKLEAGRVRGSKRSALKLKHNRKKLNNI
jgi:hypothetical protein